MKLSTIDTGYFKLDGGAMFGVVPHSMWKKLNPPDDNNMCSWAMRCLLVEDGERKILIDAGMGDKQSEKFMSHFHPHGEETLISSLIKKGISTDDITDVFITHLHFDHVGGAVSKNEDGSLEPTFKNATYWSNEKHWNWAMDPNPRERASFLKENFVPLMEANKVNFLDCTEGIHLTDRITIKYVYGHTEAMMLPLIDLENGKSILYCADLLPSTCHVGMPYVMSYDIRPLVTLEEKKRIFQEAVDKDYYLFLEHDKNHEVCNLTTNDRGRIVVNEKCKLAELTS